MKPDKERPTRSGPASPPSLEAIAYLLLLRDRMAQQPGLTQDQFNAELAAVYTEAKAAHETQQRAKKEGR